MARKRTEPLAEKEWVRGYFYCPKQQKNDIDEDGRTAR